MLTTFENLENIIKNFNDCISCLNKNGIIFIDNILYNNKNTYNDIWKFIYYILIEFKTFINVEYFRLKDFNGMIKININKKFLISKESIQSITEYQYEKDYIDYQKFLILFNVFKL